MLDCLLVHVAYRVYFIKINQHFKRCFANDIQLAAVRKPLKPHRQSARPVDGWTETSKRRRPAPLSLESRSQMTIA